MEISAVACLGFPLSNPDVATEPLKGLQRADIHLSGEEPLSPTRYNAQAVSRAAVIHIEAFLRRLLTIQRAIAFKAR